jgi:YVTN family beta-propeller protein
MEPIMDHSRFVWKRALRLAVVPLLALPLLAFRCSTPTVPESGHQLYLSPQSHPLALSNDGTRLYVANTTSGTLSVLDVSNALAPSPLAEIKVGHDPTGVAVLPGLVGGDELIFVANHVSDSISVVSRNKLAVVQTIQSLDAEGVTQTDEPVGIAFADAHRAFVTLDQPNQVLVLDVDDAGRATINPTRLDVTAQAPRSLAVAGGKLFVASFESGNQTEFPSCWPGDPRLEDGVQENHAVRTDEGCEFEAQLFEGVNPTTLQIQLGTIFDFAAVDPNIGGQVIRDIDLPDRDLFVYDAQTLALESVIDTVGTLLAGVTAHQGEGGTRVWVAHTEARNEIDGLRDLDNHLFVNRVAVLDCNGGSCAPTSTLDLDTSAAPLGQTVPNPWGIDVSGDGNTVVVTAASADGDRGDGRAPMNGLFTLDRDGNVIGSALVGALPEGVLLRSTAGGQAQAAYVLNTADSTVSVVDVSNPASPQTVGAPLTVGSDPTPAQVKLGRIAFHTARASTSKTFACGTCHPNGNIDQLQWVINATVAPGEGPAADGQLAEPRTTMPIRGLRDELPLHWEGVLADPFPGVNPEAEAFDSAPDCDISVVGEVGCVRHLVDAALSGPMCQHNTPNGCEVGEGQTGAGGAGLPGALTEEERDAMAAFQLAVPFPPGPSRRPTDKLSAAANQGVSDWFTNEDRQGVNTGVGQALNFAPTTCADNPMGCHSLPLTASTNSNIVGGFDAPSARGMWDRFTLFSNGVFSSQEVLQGAQDCADGIEPAPRQFMVNLGGGVIPITISGDPCNLRSPEIELFLFRLAELPFPSGESIWDPATGMTERGSFLATFEGIFALVYGFRGANTWEYQVELSNGLPGLTGRQIEVDPSDPSNEAMRAELDLVERYAREGRLTAVANGHGVGELRYDPVQGGWSTRTGFPFGDLPGLAATTGEVLTVTADLPENVSIGGADRQPLLDVDPDARAAEVTGDAPTLPRPWHDEVSTFRLGAEYVDPNAKVLVNGDVCEDCSITPATAPDTGKNAVDMTIDPGLPLGVHVVQVLNPNGWASNEMPLCVTNIDFDRPLPPVEEETCRPNDMTEETRLFPPTPPQGTPLPPLCEEGQVGTSCMCDPGADGRLLSCTLRRVNGEPRRCAMTFYCFNGSDCADATVTPVCASAQ